MKMLVTGGNRGLGKHLVNVFGADSASRANGFDINHNTQEIATLSLEYDIFVNNAFDGPPQEAWANFGQSQLYFAVYDAWRTAGKTGHIFNIGSVGEQHIVAPDPRFETYRVAKAALSHASRQGSQSFKQNLVKFRTTLITPDRLDTELSRSRPTWTGNGIDPTDISNFMSYAMSVNSNTVIEQATFYVNFNHNE